MTISFVKSVAPSLSLAVTLLLAPSGCMSIIYPIPNQSLETAGVRSKVLDARIGQPIAHATVSDPETSTQVTTNEAGEFILPPKHLWHAAYAMMFYGGRRPLWPESHAAYPFRRNLQVKAGGYQFARLAIEDDLDPTSSMASILSSPTSSSHPHHRRRRYPPRFHRPPPHLFPAKPFTRSFHQRRCSATALAATSFSSAT